MQESFDSAGVRIHYTDDGEGAPVLLVHGYTGAAESWVQTGTNDALANRFRVIAIDCRGHGNSGKPSTPAAYGKAMVEDLAHLLDRLKVDKAAVVGYSMGAEIALRMAVEHADRVGLLVIGGSGWSGLEDTQNYRRLADSLEQDGSFGPMIRALTPPGAPEPTVDEIRSMDRILKGQDLPALVAVAKSMGDIVNLTVDEVAAVNIPVLGIAGEHDPERANLEKFAGAMADFTMEVIPGRDHVGAMADPLFNQLIVDFLSARRGA